MASRVAARLIPNLVIVVVAGCSRWNLPPPIPDPAFLGCYRLQTTLPASYSDSLGYELPTMIHLGHSAGGQWTVLPTDAEWRPTWTIYDALPSGYVRRAMGYASAGPLTRDSVSRIPGDSIDITFPGAIGNLVLRLGKDGPDLGGRAEWVVRIDVYFLNKGKRVQAFRTTCAGLQPALRRTRFR